MLQNMDKSFVGIFSIVVFFNKANRFRICTKVTIYEDLHSMLFTKRKKHVNLELGTFYHKSILFWLYQWFSHFKGYTRHSFD